MSDAGEDWTELEDFVRMLIETGNASLESKIPDRDPLQWAVGKLSKFCAAMEAVEQSNHLSPAHKRAARRSLVLGALAAAFEIGSHGTISDNTKVVAAQVRAKEMRAAPGERRTASAEINRIIDGVIDGGIPGVDGRGTQEALISEAKIELGRCGHKLTDASVRGRVQRRLKARS